MALTCCCRREDTLPKSKKNNHANKINSACKCPRLALSLSHSFFPNRVEDGGHVCLGHRDADRVRHALPERTCRHFDAADVTVLVHVILRMPGRAACAWHAKNVDVDDCMR